MREEIKNVFDEFKTIKKEKKEGNKFLSIESYICELNNGKVITREKILKGGNDGSAVIVLPITQNEKVILAIEPRVFTEKTVDMGLPSGYIENGEEPKDAALRELKEETGYVPNRLEYLGSFYQDQGCSSALNHYFIAFDCEKKYDQNLDESEFIKYVLVDFKELDYLLDNGYIKGLNSAYIIEKAKKYMKEM